jgi:hypothetical protein
MLIRLLDMMRGRLLPRYVCGRVGSDIASTGDALSSTILPARRSGGGAAIAALCVAAIPGLNLPQRLDLMTVGEQPPWWFSPLASAAFAILIVAVFRMLFIAPYRAWRMLTPLKITVLSGLLETQYPVGQYEPQRVAISVENMAYLKINDVTVHVMTVDCVDNSNHIFPRFVEKFSIDSGEKRQISLLYRTFRSAPLANDNDITVAGPVSPGYGGNILRLPANKVLLISVRIGIPDTDPIDMSLNVWTDDTKLCAESIC